MHHTSQHITAKVGLRSEDCVFGFRLVGLLHPSGICQVNTNSISLLIFPRVQTKLQKNTTATSQNSSRKKATAPSKRKKDIFQSE